MSGFIRGTQRQPLSREEIASVIRQFVGGDEIARVIASQDPFRCDDPCPGHPAGHYLIQSADEVVCAHCSKVFWR